MAKTKKGQRFRPCLMCGEMVNYVLWEQEAKKRRARIFHWANPDGSHHFCRKPEPEQPIPEWVLENNSIQQKWEQDGNTKGRRSRSVGVMDEPPDGDRTEAAKEPLD